jgi:hypothetical protein
LEDGDSARERGHLGERLDEDVVQLVMLVPLGSSNADDDDGHIYRREN